MKLLMHMCCAPCSVYPLKYFINEKIDVTGLFYNPNIHPKEEYDRRHKSVEDLSKLLQIKVHYLDKYLEDVWLNYKDNDRCKMCYTMRLDKVASYAKEHGFDAFTTSLLISPYQKHELIKEIAEELAVKYKIPFYYIDFRPHFREGQAMAKELGLYRQKYCGCIISFNNKN